ncbi:MAG: hypothetical protein KDE09_02430 [Anaerolineales bacterium]|nr:hypothetical protein [Anaerolineales bacterium]
MADYFLFRLWQNLLGRMSGKKVIDWVVVALIFCLITVVVLVASTLLNLEDHLGDGLVCTCAEVTTLLATWAISTVLFDSYWYYRLTNRDKVNATEESDARYP